jgi:hypothetical protein
METTMSLTTVRSEPAQPRSLIDTLRAYLSKLQPADAKLPLWLKLGFTAFMAVLVPVYWANYGPSNFLYFCDLALLFTLVGIWRESPLLISMPAVGILAPQVLWIIDFVLNFAGIHLTGMTDYMFDEAKPLYLRGLSLFHGWLPLLLVFGVAKLGYDRRALKAWTALAWVAMLVAYFFFPGPSPETANAVANINYVYGMSSTESQSYVPGWVWLTGLMVLLPVAMFAPVHAILSKVWGQSTGSA